MKSKKVPRLLSISDCNWFILLENQQTDVKLRAQSPVVTFGVLNARFQRQEVGFHVSD